MTSGRSIPHSILERMRIQAIIAWKSGMSITDIAASMGIHRGSVSRWMSSYRRGGARALRSKPTPGRPRTLDCDKHGKEIVRLIQRPSTKYGFENPLWNCRRIRDVLKSELGLDVSVPTVWRSLRVLGMSCQKPERRAIEQDRTEVKKWLEKEWPKIRKKAHNERAVIFFLDEATVTLHSSIGTTWAPIGKTPIIRMTGNRASVPVISAISLRGKLFFSLMKGNINSDIFISFLENLLREVPRKKVHVIVDNARVHTAKKVHRFCEKEGRIEIHYLPKYSPELNPDEFTWCHLKQNKLRNHQAKDERGLRKKTLGGMRSIQKRPELVRSFFKRAGVT